MASQIFLVSCTSSPASKAYAQDSDLDSSREVSDLDSSRELSGAEKRMLLRSRGRPDYKTGDHLSIMCTRIS